MVNVKYNHLIQSEENFQTQTMKDVNVYLPIVIPDGAYCSSKNINCQYFNEEDDFQQNHCSLNLGFKMKKNSKGILKPSNCLQLKTIEL